LNNHTSTVLYIPSLETGLLSAQMCILKRGTQRYGSYQKIKQRTFGEICECDAENDCEICLTSKMPSTTFTKVADGAKKQIELLHSD
ncbi:hypothetical protein T4D_12287, partial [Trichinella pseudospiralis]